MKKIENILEQMSQEINKDKLFKKRLILNKMIEEELIKRSNTKSLTKAKFKEILNSFF